MDARKISVSLRRDPREVAERHSQANPLTLYCQLGRSEEVTENLSLYAELHASRTPQSSPVATAGPVAMATASEGPWELDFSAAQMNQTVLPGEDKEFWLVVYATGANDLLLTLATIRLTLAYDNISQTTPAPPEPALILAFRTIAVAGQSSIVADSSADTLTIAAGNGVSLTTNASTDTLTIAAGGPFTDLEVTGTLTAAHIHGNLAGSVYTHVRNESGGPLAKGTPVYVTGFSVGQSRPLVGRADAASASTMPAIGILDTELANNASGHCVITGIIENINTDGLTVNAPLYVASGGGLTATAPSVRAQPIAIVERVNANNGAIIVTPAATVGSLANQSAANVAITGGSITGITDLAIADGGTGASTAADARVNLGLQSQLSPSLPKMWVWDAGNGDIYCRMQFDATNDLVARWTKQAGINLNFQTAALGTVLAASAVGGTPTFATTIGGFTDDTFGYQTAANGRAGGAHGLEISRITKSGGHGLTTADIGKRYQDSNSRLYAISYIESSTVIWLAPQAVLLVSDPAGTRYNPPAGTTLTALDGQGNLSGWTAATTQGPKAAERMTQQFLVDGRRPLVAGEIVECSSLQVVEYTEVPNIRAAYDYFVATGSTAQWSDAALGNMWTRRVTYTHYPWGELQVEDVARTVAADIRFSEISNLQYQAISNSPGGGSNLWFWIPGAKSKTFSATVNGVPNATLDLNQPTYIGTLSAQISWAAQTDSLITGVLPDFMIQLLSTSTTNASAWTLGHLAALDPTWADGVPSFRVTSTNSWFRISDDRKVYPQSFSRTATWPAGTMIRLRSSRRWFPKPATNPVDAWTFIRSGDNAWLVYAAWTTAVGQVDLPLPSYLANYSVQSVRAYNGSIVSSNTANGNLRINASSANGHIIAKLA